MSNTNLISIIISLLFPVVLVVVLSFFGLADILGQLVAEISDFLQWLANFNG